jgi:hypothetical protein
VELRNELRKIDVDANGMMALLEYLLFAFKRPVGACINNAQGGGVEEVRAAHIHGFLCVCVLPLVRLAHAVAQLTSMRCLVGPALS